MTGPVRELAAMIAGLAPRLDERRWCFVSVTPDRAPELLGSAIGTFREDEGVTAIVPAALGGAAPQFARIVLQVHSDLEAAGLTAAVSGALAEVGIACNVVAALHHDHLFIPVAHANEALNVLRNMQSNSARTR